jgi:Tol biopolymer transport system component
MHNKSLRGVTYLFLVMSISLLLLVACGEEQAPQSNKDVNLPKDRVMILSNKDGWPDLYTVDFSGKFTGRLTESAAAEYGAVWSPDGKQVAFTELNGDQATGDYSRNRRIIVMDADGKNRKVIVQDGFNPVWSPDGTKILYTKLTPLAGAAEPGEGQSRNIPSSQGRFATATPAPIQPGNPFPGFDPTPAPVPGATTRPVQPSLNIVATTGENPQSALFAQDAVSGVWSPDGKRIAFVGGNNVLDQKRTLNVANADGAGKVSLTEKAKLTEQDVVYVAWSPDGTALAFTATDTQRGKTSLYRISPDGQSLRRMTDYDGSAREVMSLIWAFADYYNPAPRVNLAPVWSPNSRLIAFTDGSAKIAVVDASSTNTRYFPVGSAALGQDKDSVLQISWLPDNRRLVYDRSNAGRSTLISQAGNYIYDFFEETLETLDTANKNTAEIMKAGGAAFSPICCGMDLLKAGSPEATPQPTVANTPQINAQFREGKLIYVSGIGHRQLIVSDLKSGTQQVLSSGIFKQIDFNASPKGDRLVYIEVGERFNATLYLGSLDGKIKQKLSEGNGSPDELWYVAAWSPDGSKLAFQALNDDARLKGGLYVVNGDGNSTPVLITDKNVSAFAWSPDSKQIGYKVDADTYELYIAAADSANSGKKIVALGRTDPRYSSLGKGLAWSPDGRYLAMSGVGGIGYSSTWLLWLITPQGRVEEQPGYYINRVMSFTPDGSRLLATMASSSQRNTIQAYVLSQRLWRSYDTGNGPAVSPDSATLAFFNRYFDGRVDYQYAGSDSLQRLVLVNFSNGFSRSVALDYTPYYSQKARFYAWEPSNKALAYYQNNTIYVVLPGTSTLKPEMLARAFAVDRLAWVRG